MQLITAFRASALRLKLGGLVIVAALVGWIALNLTSLTTYPTPQPDDSFFGVVAVQFLNHGQFGNPLDTDMSGSQESLFHLGRLYIILLAIVFKVFGVGLYQGRLLVLVGHWLSVIGIFFVGKKLWGPTEGIAAALILLTAWYAFWSAHTVRPDSWVNAAGISCLLLLLQLRENPSPKLGFVVGLVAIVILDVHLKALHYTVTTLGLATAMTLPKTQTRGAFWALGAGIAVGVVYWFSLHILPDPQLALAQLQGGPNASQLTPSANLPFLVGATIRVLSAIFKFTHFGWMEAIYFIGGAIALLLSRRSSDRWAVACILLYFTSFTFLMPVKSLIHIYLLFPMIGLLTARGLALVAGALASHFSSLSRVNTVLPLLLISPLIILYIAGDVKLAWANRAISYERYSDQLLALVPANANVLGEPTWWWTFREGNFTSDLTFTAGIQASQGEAAVNARFEQALANRHVDYILLDETFGFWKDGSVLEPELHKLFANYLQHRCQDIGLVRDYFYGVDTGALDIKETIIYHCQPAN